ncbi:MAG: acetate--CoA ligase [Planctomycetota bacterium]|jgi:acetyl-CoA synthetase|nr:acetate--CoA ligase [Planctomycetota bacterium]
MGDTTLKNRYVVPSRVSAGAHVASFADYEKLYHKSITDGDAFWGEQARAELVWQQDFTTVQNCDLTTGTISWFEGGTLNVCENCVDRHLSERADQVAILWEGDEPGNNRRITYAELHEQVCRFANVLKARGVTKGDRVAIYMPMIPEVAFAMLACARIGAVHSVVFAGFSADSLRDRILDSECKVLLTADEGLRGGKTIPLKQIADKAVSQCPCISTVVVARHTGAEVAFDPSREIWLHEAMAEASTDCPAVPVGSEDLLFLLYTSGSTGKPKGLAHSSAGYLLYTKLTHRLVFDYREGDIYACMADVGWITGHSYIVYGPLANGATTVMFESIPTYPDCGRYWDMVERLKINSFYTAPTAIRAIARAGDEFVTKYDRSSLRVLGTVGEPINPEAWRWYYELVGDSQCSVVDTWWQTETGGHMITGLPGATDMKPGSASFPFLGVEPVVLDTETGREIDGNGVSGVLAIKRSWPAQARTIYGDHQRFMDTYLSAYKGYYFTGDGCRRDEDGYYWITGRVDDVINVSGHRMGTAEVESALVEHEACAEAAVVGFPHDIKGQGIFAYVILKDGFDESATIVAELKAKVREIIGPIATPDAILITPGLPKTRSGKIMRRILRKIAANDAANLGDTSTLADPSVVDVLKERRTTLD